MNKKKIAVKLEKFQLVPEICALLLQSEPRLRPPSTTFSGHICTVIELFAPVQIEWYKLTHAPAADKTSSPLARAPPPSKMSDNEDKEVDQVRSLSNSLPMLHPGV
eukprot:257978-Rhodomonas_salina.1